MTNVEPSDNSIENPIDTPAERRVPSSQPVLMRAVKWGLIATVSLIAIFALIGWLVSGSTGLIGGVIGAAIGGLLCLMTAGSIVIANRFVEYDFYVALFFGIVLGGWILKFVAFIIAALLLRDQPWLNPTVLFFGVIAGVIVSLIIDAVVMMKTRMPYVSDPHTESPTNI